MKDKPIILFDLDGTVIDSTQAILESFHNAFNHYKVKAPSDDTIKSMIGHPLDEMYRSFGVGEDDVWDYVATYKEYYMGIACQKTLLLPKAKEAIELASQFARLGIVTTKTGKYSKEIMEHFGLMAYFETLIGREHVVNPKPDAEPIEKALDAMNVTKGAVWLIGDTHMDICSAKNAGIEHIAVTSGYESEEDIRRHTQSVVADVFQAVKSIEKHWLHS